MAVMRAYVFDHPLTGPLQAQGHRASALNLVAGAIVLWNTTYLEAVLRHMEQQGKQIPAEFLQHLSPPG